MKNIALKIVEFYKIIISPIAGFFGFNCRFYPSCSIYAADTIKKYGVIRGGCRAILRLSKCGPWNRGGIDQVK